MARLRGYSAVFGVNYVGHQVLVSELQRRLTVGRIVLLSSVMHRWASHDAATLSDPRVRTTRVGAISIRLPRPASP